MDTITATTAVEPVSRAVVDAFFKVYAQREADKVAQFLDDQVEWTISGPIEYLAFCGTHRGKQSVVDLIKIGVPQVLRVYSFVPESILIDGDQVASLSRQLSRRAADGRAMSFRVANFMRFRGGKLVKNLSLIDTFDAVEQVLGRPLVNGHAGAANSNVVAL